MKWILAALVVILVVVVVGSLGLNEKRPRSIGDDACTMARYFVHEQMRKDGMEPYKARVTRCGEGRFQKAGPNSWIFTGTYKPPINSHTRLPFEIKIYGPFNQDKWRMCKLTMVGDVVFQIAAAVPCD